MKLHIALIAALSLTACSSEIDGKTAASVEEVPSSSAPAASEKPAVETKGRLLKADPAGSKVGFVGAKVTDDHSGEIKKLDGTGRVEGGKLTSMVWTFDMDSIEADHPKLTKHLKSDDFFDVANHPTATFEATEITAAQGARSHEITGTLDLHGVRKQITFPADVDVTEEGARVQAEFTIERFDWKIEYKGKADDLIKDEVLIKVDVSLKNG